MSDLEKKNPLFTLLIIINTFIVGFILIRQLRISKQVDTLTTPKQSTVTTNQNSPYLAVAKAGSTIREYPFGSFTANLTRSSGPQRYITIDIVLYIETSSTKPLLEIENRKQELRDEINSILNTRAPHEVLKLEGRGLLKSLLKDHLNNLLKSDKVRDLLLVKFLVN